jgi:hypothetical protein
MRFCGSAQVTITRCQRASGQRKRQRKQVDNEFKCDAMLPVDQAKTSRMAGFTHNRACWMEGSRALRLTAAHCISLHFRVRTGGERR